MKNTFNIGKIDQMAVIDGKAGPIVYTEKEGRDSAPHDSLPHLLAEIKDADLRANLGRIDPTKVNQRALLAIAQLQIQLDQILGQIGAEQKSEVLRLNRTFSEEVQKGDRNTETAKISGHGLIEAAKTVAAMAEPIAVSVRTVLSLISS